MSRNSKPDAKPIGEKAAREARLAQALRTNLRRRKAAPVAAAKPEPAPERGETSSD
jgi:hypothetical protein